MDRGKIVIHPSIWIFLAGDYQTGENSPSHKAPNQSELCMTLEENVRKCLNNVLRAYNTNSGPYTLMLKHENQIQNGMKNRINIHIKKLLIEEKDDT